MNSEKRMSLQTRIWVTLAVLVVLAVAGEFVGAARRRFLRRDVPEVQSPTLLPGQVLLRVKGPDGWPVPQARVVQIGIAAPPGRPIGTRQAYGMSSGFVVLSPLAAGETVRRLEVSGATDTADASLPFGAVLTQPVPEGATSFEVVLPMEQTIAGSIRQGGKPVKDIKVKARMAYPAELDGLSEPSNDIWQDIRVTGEDGRFLLQHLGAGLQEVSFQGSVGIAIADRRIQSGTPLHIDMDTVGAGTVTVVDGSGSPIGKATAFVVETAPGILGKRETRARGITDLAGRVRFQGLDPGRKYRLFVTRPGTVEGGPGEELDWTPSDVTVNVGNQRSVQVRVLDEKGAPHTGVAVTAMPAKAGRPGVSGITGSTGYCSLYGLDAGPLQVTVKDVCSFLAEESVATTDVGETEKEVTFTMERGASITLWQGPGPRSLTARAVLREEGSNAAAVGVLRGAFVSWHGVNAGSTYAAVLVDAERGLAARVEGIRGAVNPMQMTLAPALSLKVSVQWPEGAGDRMVYASWGDQAAGYGAEQPDGIWLIGCLPPGKYFVGASCSVPGRKEKASAVVEAAAGGEASIRVR